MAGESDDWADAARRLELTRARMTQIANLLLLGQNYHLIHHLWTTIPWYRYQDVYRELEPELRARGCPIGWTTPAAAPDAVGATPDRVAHAA